MDYQNTNTDVFTYKGPLATRMACHLGDNLTNSASALCNILGDQPLFYIDYLDEEEADFIDPNLLGDPMLSDLMEEGPFFMPVSGGPADPNLNPNLNQRIARLEKACAHIDGYQKPDVTNAFDMALNALNAVSEETDITEFVSAIQNSRFLSSMYADVTKAGITFKTSYQVDKAAYDRDQKTIYINPSLTAFDGVLAVTPSIRQAWLQLKGAAINPLHFAPEDAVLLNRIQMADLACTSIRAAWDLKLAGFDAPWARILTGSSYDLAQSFAREAITDFRALQTGAAVNTTFEKWFFSGRCKEVDRKIIQSMLSDNHGLVFNHPQISRSITADVIARTGDQPEGRNYMTGLVEVIMADPLFTEVRDRSNANFLWFIKFERSFRVSENTQNPDAQTEKAPQKQVASVVNFPVSATRNTAEVKATGTGNMATVYYLDHFLSL